MFKLLFIISLISTTTTSFSQDICELRSDKEVPCVKYDIESKILISTFNNEFDSTNYFQYSKIHLVSIYRYDSVSYYRVVGRDTILNANDCTLEFVYSNKKERDTAFVKLLNHLESPSGVMFLFIKSGAVLAVKNCSIILYKIESKQEQLNQVMKNMSNFGFQNIYGINGKLEKFAPLPHEKNN